MSLVIWIEQHCGGNGEISSNLEQFLPFSTMFSKANDHWGAQVIYYRNSQVVSIKGFVNWLSRV